MWRPQIRPHLSWQQRNPPRNPSVSTPRNIQRPSNGRSIPIQRPGSFTRTLYLPSHRSPPPPPPPKPRASRAPPQFGRMALANKIGSLLKKATNSSPTLYQAIRCMSSSKLFVGGLSYGTDDHSLKDAFANYGQVIEARIIQDRETGRSRGFGFVTYTSSEEAAAAITALDGQDLHGRSIRVNYATERTGGFRSGGFGGYGGGGGFGGGGGGGYGGSYGNRGGDYGGSGGGGYGVAGGSRDNDTFSGTNFAGGGGNNFTGSNFGGDSGFSGNPAGNFGAAGGSTGGDDFSGGAPGDNFESGKNDDLMGDLIKDDEPDTYANKRG